MSCGLGGAGDFGEGGEGSCSLFEQFTFRQFMGALYFSFAKEQQQNKSGGEESRGSLVFNRWKGRGRNC